MGVEYKGLMAGHQNPIDIAKMIAKLYGGRRFSIQLTGVGDGFYYIIFLERPTKEQELLSPWEQAKVIRERQLAVFTDGACAGDYADLTTEPMTYLALGRHGDCEDIINVLVAQTGGWIMDEAGDQEWHRVEKAA